MRRVIILIMILCSLVMPVYAMDYHAPEVPNESAWLMEESSDTFAEGIQNIIQKAIPKLYPALTEAMQVCLYVICGILAVSVIECFCTDKSTVTSLTGTVLIGYLMLRCADSMIDIGSETIFTISEYGKLFLPVITAVTAAQGGVATSSALYAGTAFFDSILSALVSEILVPMLYVYLCLSIAAAALSEDILQKLKDFIKQIMTWLFKTILYVFTGYLSITGVISGTTDAAALKAAKLAISSCVPVVGSILSDASESVLISAGVMKNAAGIYGILAFIAICIVPFMKISVYYFVFRVTAAICSVFGNKNSSTLIKDFSSAIGLILAMTGTVCLMFLISTVCFMKGAV